MRVKQTLKPQGPATAIVLTDAQVEQLDGGKRAAVTVTIGGNTARLRLAVMGGQNLIGISKANRAELGVEIGDTVDATLELDGATRTVDVPDDAAKALAKAKLRASSEDASRCGAMRAWYSTSSASQLPRPASALWSRSSALIGILRVGVGGRR